MSNKLWQGKTILVVDDSEVIRIELSGTYSDLGMRVVDTAKNGIEGIELYKKHTPDFVSLDIIMPEMHGIDCYRRLLAIAPNLEFLFVSCLAGDPTLLAAFDGKIPAARFVPKPGSYEKIEKALLAAFGGVPVLQNIEIADSVQRITAA
jgi:two-component system chemotaxis response regulator CheY